MNSDTNLRYSVQAVLDLCFDVARAFNIQGSDVRSTKLLGEKLAPLHDLSQKVTHAQFMKRTADM